MLVGQRISPIPPYGLQNYVAGILASLERVCHCDRHGLSTLSGLFPNFAMKPDHSETLRNCAAEKPKSYPASLSITAARDSMSNPAYVPHHGETRFASSALISIATSIVVLHGRPSAFQIAAGICIAWVLLDSY
jgi:hypothetical protein